MHATPANARTAAMRGRRGLAKLQEPAAFAGGATSGRATGAPRFGHSVPRVDGQVAGAEGIHHLAQILDRTSQRQRRFGAA